MADETSLTADQRLVLQAIYDRFRADGAWPAFLTVDRPLRRERGMDTGAVAQTIPESLLLRTRPGNFRPGPNDLLRLTIVGIAACDSSQDDIDYFVRLLRWLAELEVEFEPGPAGDETMPRVSSADVRKHLGISETDPGLLRRLYAMLQLDHWGLGSHGGTPDDWYVNVGPEVWRFRDVQTAADCAAARENWLSEGSSFDTAVLEEDPPGERAGDDMAEVTPAGIEADATYYHVRISTKSSPRDEVRLDLSLGELTSRFLEPYREGRPMVAGGRTIPIDDLTKIRISHTDLPSAELRPRVEAERRRQGIASPLSTEWLIAKSGVDVTDSFITEPPGTLVVAAAPAPPAVVPRKVALYVDQTLVAAIRAKAEASQLDCTKILQLVDELNDNFARGNPYAVHALLRAVLDHVPPILGCKGFTEVANNYGWTQTDKRYIKRLLDFKLQGDDVLHRQISEKADLLGMDDLPPRAWINKLLQECAEKL